ncbi:hypothetical protein ADL05_18590 [Nocardiopsis sp. NRRL B-16309]|nr:hypothetical protein ADL05_18590 [Nocardiopsis sp. NRRL B-16309]
MWMLAGAALVVVALAFGVGRTTATAPTQENTTQADTEQTTSTAQEETLDVQGLAWREHGGITLPFSAEHGPLEDDQGWVRGFTRTESGAVLAALHIFFQGDRSADLPEQVIRTSLEEQWTGEHTEERIAAMDRLGFEPNPDRGSLEPHGYLVHEYSESGAVIELAVNAHTEQGDGSPTTSGMLVTLLWADGDWRRLVPESDMDHVRLLDAEEMITHGFTEFAHE